MLFSDRPRAHYRNAPVHEVICQLRFPTILTINTAAPADLQEAVREEFPRYAQRQEARPPLPGGQAQSPVVNYAFLSEDGAWKLSLTQDFIALSTLRYDGWESFAQRLDKPLASFIRLYRPAFFQRVGLRYINLISRERLGLVGTPWAELIAPAYVGPLLEEDVREASVVGCGVDLVLKLDSSCAAKIHAGPGMVKKAGAGAAQDPEAKFVFDMDLSMGGSVSTALSAGALETLHGHAGRVFEGAVTDALREAMDPA
ncbi:MAG: TIGR04255 family protein [Oscillibacter sp.]|nr:TIGR04255 family protein [Oscillibacter sp.]